MSSSPIADLQSAGKYLLDNGLTWGTSGNLSARVGPDEFVITASGTRLGELTPDDFVTCRVSDEAGAQYARKPSKEVPMHRAIYALRPEIGAVLHASPFYATLAACANLPLPADWFVEDMYYLERVERVPYAHPGSARLGELVAEHARAANVLLLENHGVLVCDISVGEALVGLHTLEVVARMAVEARRAGIEMRSLPADVVADFLGRSGYRKPRAWPQ